MGAMCDINTGKIVGCAEGSKDWYHEKGHILFNETENGLKIGYMRELFSYLALIMTVGTLFINPLKYLALVCISISVYAYIYEEVWCEKYAKKMFKEKQNGLIQSF